MGDVTYNEEQTCVYILQDASTLTVPELAENVKLADANSTMLLLTVTVLL